MTRSAVGGDGTSSGLEERRHFDRVDLDRDGSITLEEFMAAASSAEVSPSRIEDPDATAAATIAHFDQVGWLSSDLSLVSYCSF